VKPFYIFNTFNRTVEELRAGNPPEVTYYSCGPTVYLPQHLGNMRAYLFVDTFRRALRFNGFNVHHVMNITDVGHMTSDEDSGEDKIEKTARAEHKSPREVADFYIAQFKRDCARLNIELPQPPLLCRATDHIPDMIVLIKKILHNGFAYVRPSGVYFNVKKWRGPSRRGRLSRQSLDEQHAGQRLEHSPDKKSPHDFALWVLNQPTHLMQWESPWGRGYPGWHIECSAMSMKYLGETLDIHSGGLDHIPVHHEDEIAQSEAATGRPFVRYFVHNAFLVGMEGAKISKSAGRFPVLDDLLNERINPLAFRWLCLMAKYRSELRFDIDILRASENSYVRVCRLLAQLPTDSKEHDDADWVAEYRERFHEAINDDLNTAQALAVVIEMVRRASGNLPGHGSDPRIWKTLRDFDMVLAADLEKQSDYYRVNPELRTDGEHAAIAQTPQGDAIYAYALAQDRVTLRQAKKYDEADAIRNQLLEMGYVVEDVSEKPGFRLRRR
jgi:cysteinyl-tRNA synthetase